MSRRRHGSILVVLVALLGPGTAHAAHRHSPSPSAIASTQRPDTFGTFDYTIDSLSDLSFTAYDPSVAYVTHADDYFRYIPTASGGSFVAGAIIPAGAIIDYIGLGSCDPAGLAFIVYADELDAQGTFVPIVDFGSSAHGAGTPCTVDYNSTPAGYQIAYNQARTIQIEVNQVDTAPTDGTARFSGVEIWWHRSVSPAPATATFNDVPTSHPFFQYIEALAASQITGGCGSGNYCPDQPVTRGQMAVFLSKALGLHFPGTLPF